VVYEERERPRLLESKYLIALGIIAISVFRSGQNTVPFQYSTLDYLITLGLALMLPAQTYRLMRYSYQYYLQAGM
jgi:hypothetical protein